MKKNPFDIQHLTAADLKTSQFDKIILPLGSLESHGEHLPFGTDALMPHLLALEVAARVQRTAVLPPVNYGPSAHYSAFSFTVTLRFDTETAIIRDILESVYREGIRKVFILNGHDGNIAPIEIAARTAKVAHPDFRIVSLDAWWKTICELVGPGFFDAWDGQGHGGEAETSFGLALFPALVDPSKAVASIPELPPYIEVKWAFDELTTTGSTGDGSKGTVEKGLHLKEVLVDTLVKVITDLDRNDWDYRSPQVSRGG